MRKILTVIAIMLAITATSSAQDNTDRIGIGTGAPCLYRARNRYGSARIGVSLGAAPTDFLAGIHAGWQHRYALKGGWQFFWQAGVDLMLPKRDDLFRAGAGIGVKLPVRDRHRYR